MSDADQRKKAFAIGYLAGLCGMPLATALGQANDPLYLYGGVALPPLPAEWDRETYPYAIISKSRLKPGAGVYHLSVYKSIYYFEITLLYYPNKYFGTSEEETSLVFEARPGETSWSLTEDTQYSVCVEPSTAIGDIAIWTHGFDLMYSDDSLYVAASAPERITDWDALKGQYFYNEFIATLY